MNPSRMDVDPETLQRFSAVWMLAGAVVVKHDLMVEALAAVRRLVAEQSARIRIEVKGDFMSKTLVDLDEDLLTQAERILGTTTKKATVNTALREVVRLAAVKELMRLGNDGVYDGLLGSADVA